MFFTFLLEIIYNDEDKDKLEKVKISVEGYGDYFKKDKQPLEMEKKLNLNNSNSTLLATANKTEGFKSSKEWISSFINKKVKKRKVNFKWGEKTIVKYKSFNDEAFCKLRLKFPKKYKVTHLSTYPNQNLSNEKKNPLKRNLTIDSLVRTTEQQTQQDNEIKSHISLMDYENLPHSERFKYDTRGFWAYLFDSIQNDTKIVSLFFKRSLIYPTNIRLIRVFSFMSFMIGLNAILYQDNDIRMRMKLEFRANVKVFIKLGNLL